ncbi:MAG: hypothetical protein ABIS50_15595 [Luteolibacter sp.]|uniref:hypothetical protein n=1 Tax=Luteolibacter sp. TaxID=1962973 RepID=UPI003266FE42
MSFWQTISARIVRGHQVASGQNEDPRFPGGTLRMQAPFFKALGLDLAPFHPGTLNISLAPCGYIVRRPRHTFKGLKWHPVEPAEDFSFFDVRVICPDGSRVTGFIYFPHPATKPEHFQNPDVLELLLPYVEGLSYGMELRLEIPQDQMGIEYKGGQMDSVADHESNKQGSEL